MEDVSLCFQPPIIGKYIGHIIHVMRDPFMFNIFLFVSDQMGNKGAFITLTKELEPKFATYEAVVSKIIHV